MAFDFSSGLVFILLALVVTPMITAFVFLWTAQWLVRQNTWAAGIAIPCLAMVICYCLRAQFHGVKMLAQPLFLLAARVACSPD